MIKTVNFNDFQIARILKTLSPKMNVRINKAGNISITNPKESNKGYWILYHDIINNRFIWRRHDRHGYCYPLHMTGRKRIGEIHKDVYAGRTFIWYKREWDMNNCYFDSFDNALDYFVKYLKKYKNINI